MSKNVNTYLMQVYVAWICDKTTRKFNLVNSIELQFILHCTYGFKWQ